jgi:hypothetical protein
MNRAEVAAMAWALTDSATKFLPKDARARLWIKIGAGDQDDAIVEVLTAYARGDVELPMELAGAVDDWISGYRGADEEPILRGLQDRIAVRPSMDIVDGPTQPLHLLSSGGIGASRASDPEQLSHPRPAQAKRDDFLHTILRMCQ